MRCAKWGIAKCSCIALSCVGVAAWCWTVLDWASLRGVKLLRARARAGVVAAAVCSCWWLLLVVVVGMVVMAMGLREKICPRVSLLVLRGWGKKES